MISLSILEHGTDGVNMIDIVENVEQLVALKDVWRMLEQNPLLRLPQTYDWCYHGWQTTLSKSPKNCLWVLRWHRDGVDDCVIFPFYIDARGTLRFLMDPRNDTCDCVYLPGKDRHWCYREVAELILKEPRIKSVFLQKMRSESEAFNYLSVFLSGATVYKDNAYSWLRVPISDDFIAHHNQLKSKDKADLRAIRRKAASKVVRVLSSSRGNPFPRETVISLRSAMIGKTRATSAFLTDQTIDFAEAIYNAGCLEVVEMLSDGEVIGLNFLQRKGGRRLSWIFLYTDSRASTEMYVKYLSEECQKESFIFDFGVGVYSYKIGTFRPQTSVTCAIAMGKTPWQHLKFVKGMLARQVKDYLKGHLGWGKKK